MGSSVSKDQEAQKTAKPRAQATKYSSKAYPAREPSNIQSDFPQPYKDPKAKDDSCSFPLDGRSLSSVSDQQLAEMFFIAPKIHEYGDVTIVRLSESLVVKGGLGVAPSEARNMIFAAESLHLPAPKVYRIFTADIPGIFGEKCVKGHFIIMDYVPGPTVEDCWQSLGSSQRQSVTHQVVAMINLMQSTPLELSPGPIGRMGDQKFEGPWFTDDGAGPFATLLELQDWCNHKLDVSIRLKQAPRFTKRFRFQRVVLTHQDIAPRNLILDSKGQVWIIDWGLAGVYPVGFEQAVFRAQSGRHIEFAEMVLVGLSDQQTRLMGQYSAIQYGLSVGRNL